MLVHDDTVTSAVSILLDSLEETEVIFPSVLTDVHAMGISWAGITPTTPY
jgi:hypothetical protein